MDETRKQIIIIGHQGDGAAITRAKMLCPEAEVITAEEAERRGIPMQTAEPFNIKPLPKLNRKTLRQAQRDKRKKL